jgi:hypothetical protein
MKKIKALIWRMQNRDIIKRIRTNRDQVALLMAIGKINK